MSDNLKRYRAIKDALKQLYPQEPQGQQARHLQTLAALISGIVGSQRVNLPAMARKVPDGARRESRVKRFSRWLKNDRIEGGVYFMPFAEALIAGLAHQALVLVIDGSDVGRGCITLMVSVLYKKRALPLAWLVIEGSKGHFPETAHITLLEQVRTLIPPEASVIFLGDGEFDGIELQATLATYGWLYVCRTAKNIQLCEEGEWFTFEDLAISPGRCVGIPDVLFTAQAYGPVLAIAQWGAGHKHPLYLVTNMELVEEACFWYRKRFHIETFFSDQKTRGFHLHKSHLSDPQRLARLMIAACLAYIWIVFLGALAKAQQWVSVIHRSHRCDLSLFQLGLDLLEHFLNECLPIPVAFQMPQQEAC
jgi:hypothetical protein